jgi:ATP-binding cassette subfamily C protein CydC
MSERAGIVREALTRERRAVRGALWAGLLVTLCTVGLAATSAWLIVRAAQRPSVLSLTVPMGLVQLFALAKAGGRYLERTQTHRAALSAMGHVRARVADELEPLLPAGLGPRSADVVDTVLGDVERVQDLLTAVAGPLLTSVAAGLVSVVVCGVMSPVAGAVLLVAIAVDAVFLPGLALRLGRGSGEVMDKVHAEMTSLFDQVAQSGDEFVMVGATSHLERRLANLEERGDAAQRRRRAATGVVSGLAVLINGVACIVVTAVSAGDVRSGHLAAALVAVPALTTIAALELVSGLVTGVVGASRDRAAMTRLNALHEKSWPVREPSETVERPVLDARVGLHDVSHAYDDVRVLEHVTCQLHAGDVVVLSGPSGGGKTTLARLVAKFLDPSLGRMTLGDEEYSSLRSDVVRGVVGLVDDAPYVFATTLADNLRIARPTATDAQLERACEEAGLGDFLRALPDGLHTQLGGVDTGLSGGEQRRLGVARELLADRPVTIFDEPTEGLDDAAARAMLVTLREHYRDGVLVVISHQDAQRLASARQWRVEKGRLVETVDDLAAIVRAS